MAGAPDDVGYKNNTHIPGISEHYFPKDVAEWPKWTRLDRRYRGNFTLQYRLIMLRTGFEDACYEHVPLVKSGEDNLRIQPKGMLIKGPVSTS